MAPKKQRSPPFVVKEGSSSTRRQRSLSSDVEPPSSSSSSRPNRPRWTNIQTSSTSSSAYPSISQSHYSTQQSPFPPPDSPQAPSGDTAPGSRRQSTSTMRTSSMPFEGPPSSTPTGRISKAKKGKRVHACSYEGCGKVFTRAEHRRRHELNHNPEAMYPCTRPGCRKAFHRLDLLQRHQERHDIDGSLESPTMRHRQTSQISTPGDIPQTMPTAPMSSPAPSHNPPRTSSGALSIGSLVHPQEYRYGLGTPVFGGFGRPVMPFVNGFAPDDSMYYTPESSQSPVSEQYGRYPHRQSISSASSTAAYEPPGASPLLHGNVPNPWVTTSAPPTVLPATMLEDGAYVNVGQPFFSLRPYTEADQSSSSSADSSLPIPLSELDGYEWTVIRRELSSASGLFPTTDDTGISDTIRWYCLEYYWQYFHSLFPIVHRPTFLPTKPSPLLACAMLAIGSRYDQREDAKRYSLTLLEVATKLLRRRDNISSRSRLADLQTVFLLEVLSKYCARRIEVEMSARFRSLFASLDQARRSLATNPLAVFRTLRKAHTKEELTKAHKFWVEHETRRRILQASSVLDKQQVILFGQLPTVIQHGRTTRLNTDTTRTSITLPCSEELWNTSPIEKWAESAKDYDYIDPTNTRPSYRHDPNPKMDYFQMQVKSATEPTMATSDLSHDGEGEFRLLGNPTNTACAVFHEHAFAMAKHIPLHPLLIVSGESWIFGKKLESESDFQAASQTLRQWINSGTDSLIALWHATALIRNQSKFMISQGSENETSVTFEENALLHESWCMYLAALVCWAHGLGVSVPNTIGGRISRAASIVSEPTSHHSTSTLSAVHPSLLDPGEAAIEMQEYLRGTDVSSPEYLVHLDPRTISRTHGLLECIRTRKIGLMIGGLMNEAERVLFRLVEGRGRLSYF